VAVFHENHLANKLLHQGDIYIRFSYLWEKKLKKITLMQHLA